MSFSLDGMDLEGVPMLWPRIVQLSAGIALVAGFELSYADRNGLGMKGAAVDVTTIVACFAASALTACVVTRKWHWLPAPFLAGFAGLIFGGALGPFGGIYGTLIGVAVVAITVSQSHLRKCGSE